MSHTPHESLPDKKKYPRKSVGYVVSPHVPVVSQKHTLEEVQNLLTQTVDRYDSLNYIYIVDDAGTLTGVFSIKELYRKPPETSVKDVGRHTDLVTIAPDVPKEAAADKALQHNIKAVPVVEKDGTFIGAVPSDTILAILEHEHRKDLLRLTGVQHDHEAVDDVFKVSAWTAIKHRLPWLLVGLVGGLIAAQIVEGFETVLREHLILAAFIPLVVYLADAVGTQMQSFVIRDFSTHRKLNFKLYLFKQFRIVTIIALVLGLVLGIVNVFLYRSPVLAIVLASAVTGAIFSSLFSGLVIPYLFRTIGVDPANASGPIGTIVQDITSVLIYFSIAAWLL